MTVLVPVSDERTRWSAASADDGIITGAAALQFALSMGMKVEKVRSVLDHNKDAQAVMNLQKRRIQRPESGVALMLDGVQVSSDGFVKDSSPESSSHIGVSRGLDYAHLPTTRSTAAASGCGAGRTACASDST